MSGQIFLPFKDLHSAVWTEPWCNISNTRNSEKQCLVTRSNTKKRAGNMTHLGVFWRTSRWWTLWWNTDSNVCYYSSNITILEDNWGCKKDEYFYSKYTHILTMIKGVIQPIFPQFMNFSFFPLVFLGLDVKVSVQNLWNFLCSFVFAFEACSINLLCFLFLVAPVTD